jgi:hypothetical protein
MGKMEPDIDEAIAAVEAAFPGAKVVEVRDGPTRDERLAEAFFAGKLPAFDAELAEVKEEGERVAFFAQLRYHALTLGRKPGWAKHFFKSIYGTWPERGWEKVSPMRPTGGTMQLVQSRDAKWRSETKMQRQREEQDPPNMEEAK